ncbi:hypothetical protein EJ08DRAFT_423000 [Tothia fuscella]|uniref:DUF7702 domain-containing protein n=1 Tax=Tothia fuscella TaxID=1048955 RepID=A0A9P4NJL4_9PEZI|nr:hypothetical protein EJ08DRAFT_423000 [Tothia fuscella]
MHLDSQGAVSIVELIVYFPAITASAIICSRHGFTRSSGWVYTFILCLVRILGAICQLVTYSDHSSGLIKAVIIIDSIGISPLLLATLGMLSRLVDWINAGSQGFFSAMHFRLIQIVISVGLILSIVGGTNLNTNSDGSVKIGTESKVGIILYIVAFVACIVVCLLSLPQLSWVPKEERKISIAVLLAFPFIGIRLLYSVLAVFLHNHNFSIYNGSVGVHVGMAVVEEFIVVFIYIFLGFKLSKLALSEQGPIVSRVKGNKGSSGHKHHRRHSRQAYDLPSTTQQSQV